METIALLERVLGYAGGLAALAALVLIFAGILRGARRPPGHASGRVFAALRQPLFYVFSGLAYFAVCFALWRPLPVALSSTARVAALALGAPLFFGGLGLLIWGRLALGRQYFTSSALGAQLFAGHQLITQGPYAWVRHPMYLGILLAGLGGIGLYRTWTVLFIALNALTLALRAGREEQALAAEFGANWRLYCQRTPAFIPRTSISRLPAGAQALLEVGLLFLPAIPAYLWMWPVVAGDTLRAANLVTYVYVLAGTLLIGRRRWSWDQLGVNRRGVWLSLAFGAAVVLGRLLVVLAVDWGAAPRRYSPLGLLVEFLFYFGLVGLVEELLFRGLVYRAFADWLGLRWAIWGTSLGFVLWHIFGHGPVVGAAMLLYGLIFALLRWRGGGILGLILVHGAMDFANLFVLPDVDLAALGRPEVPYPGLLLLGMLLLLLPLSLWRFNPAALLKPRSPQKHTR